MNGNQHRLAQRCSRPIALAMAALLLFVIPADAGVRRIWAVNDGEKVERDAQNHPAMAGNSVWDGHVIRVFGARNEVVAVQVIVEADAHGLAARFPERAAPASIRLDRVARRGSHGRTPTTHSTAR